MQGDLVGLANLLAEEIDGNQRGYQNCGYQRPATNLAARKSEIVKCRIPQHDRNVACYADCVGNRHYVEPAFHLTHPCAHLPIIAGMANNGCEQVHILGAEMPIMRNAASRSRAMVK